MLRRISVQTCLGNDFWSGDRPTCTEATCDAGDMPEHGSVSREGVGGGVRRPICHKKNNHVSKSFSGHFEHF